MPPVLKRDHAILEALGALLHKCTSTDAAQHTHTISLHEIAFLTSNAAPEIYSNPRSLNQAVSSVVRKVLDLYGRENDEGGAFTSKHISYPTERARGTDGLVSLEVDVQGARALFNFVASWCTKMETDTTKQVIDEWHPSRSARAHAAHLLTHAASSRRMRYAAG